MANITFYFCQDLHKKSFDNFLNNKIRISFILLASNFFLNFKSDNIVFCNIKKPFISFPKFFLKSLNRELTLYEQYCKDIMSTYDSYLYYSLCSISINHIKKSKIQCTTSLPMMLGSIRCNVHSQIITRNVQLSEKKVFKTGYFVSKGKSKVIRISNTIKKNHIFLIKKKSHKSNASKTYILIKISKKNSENFITKIFLSRSKGIIFIFGSRDYDIEIFSEVLLCSILDNKKLSGQISNENHYSNFYNGRICRHLLKQFYINSNLVQHAQIVGLGLYSKFDYFNYVGKVINCSNLLDFFSNFMEVGCHFIRNTFLGHLYNSSNKHNYFRSIYLRLVENKIFKDSSDNLNLTINLEYILPGDVCTLALFKSAMTIIFRSSLKLKDNINKNSMKNSTSFSKDFYSYTNINKKIFSRIKIIISVGHLKDLVSHSSYENGNSVLLEKSNMSCYFSNFDLVHRGQYFKKSQNIYPRLVSLDSLGYLCPVQTPDGASSGLINHLSLLTAISIDCEFDDLNSNFFIQEFLLSINFLPIESKIVGTSFENLISAGLNNMLIGLFFHSLLNEKIRFYHFLKSIRLYDNGRNLFLNHSFENQKLKIFDTEAAYFTPSVPGNEMIQFYTNANRPLRLLKLYSSCSFEFIGMNEFINLSVKWLDSFSSQKFFDKTHQDLGNIALLSFTASLIPFWNHNQSPRNIYQCQMSKQAIGAGLENSMFCQDTKVMFLYYPQKYLFKKFNRIITRRGLLPYGNNIIISIGSNSQNDMEDACVLNKFSSQNGLFHTIILKKVKQNNYLIEKDKEKIALTKNIRSLLNSLIINKSVRNLCHNRFILSSIFNYTKKNKVKVQEYNNFDQFTYFGKEKVKSKTRFKFSLEITKNITRNILVGDKLASLHGQKSVVSTLISREDLPFSFFDGIIPEVSLNPHSFPSRMTIGMLKEMALLKNSIFTGKLLNLSDFTKHRKREYDWYNDISVFFKEYGHTNINESLMIDGRLGITVKTFFYNGVVFYQRLPQMVNDKMQFSFRSPTEPLTKQPRRGRKYGGAIRFGEMEKDALISHGASALVNDRLSKSSDYYVTLLCVNCNNLRVGFNKDDFSCFKSNRKINLSDQKCCNDAKYHILIVPFILISFIRELKYHSIKALINVL
ncbi:second-largest subunit of DNA-directed RNA polymerase I (nucleomorph) [Bigelowiella natans]|uniref:DNA-directed RNA polymerase n=1 Tax=Bigelowiella natans TaxID=227086 RepID=Q3LVX3_BIGNA|nr:second-largest subunit of DNA-directed RNA polymerase I [Bigelowiella natans]ABA27392.1 second-largest subunit of DNA-directed RNA polymerase I [Bigelowiella natans]